MTRRFYGWRVVEAGAAIQAFHSFFMVQAYGHYAVFLERDFGWSKTALSGGYALNRVESGLLGPLQGWALDRFGSRKVMQLGTVLMAAGFLALSRINNLGQFYAALLLVSVGISLSGFLSIVTAIVGWFERKRAQALSAASVGCGIGGMAVPGIVWYSERYGWRSAFVRAAIVVIFGVGPMTLVFGATPESRGEPVDGEALPEGSRRFRAEGLSAVHFTAAEALRTRAFWMISLGHGSALLVVGSVLAHLPLYLTGEHGYSEQEAAFVAAFLPFFQLVGMMLGGYLGDRVNKRLLASVAMLGHMAGLLVLTFAVNRLLIWLFVPLHGLAWGVRGPLMQALRADYFGSTSFGKIMGISSMIIMGGTVVGPLLAGVVADSTGSYRLGFTVIAVLAGLGMTFFVLATPPPPPVRGDTE